MKICDNHIQKLRVELDKFGILSLCANGDPWPTGSLIRALDRWDGSAPIHQYDPLRDCCLQIADRALRIDFKNMYLLVATNAGKQFCPVCEAVDHGIEEIAWLVPHATTAYIYCRDNGLLGMRQ